MIEFKIRGSRSWFDSRYGKRLSYELAEKLVDRVGNEDARFVTLTYKRDVYSDPQDLYRRSQEERHVRVFLGRLARSLGRCLTGKWLCKLEFQSGGWVHWHLLIVGAGFIENRDNELTKLWGHGFAFIERANERQIRYVCKYISKDGEIPPWIYLEPVRSIKIVRVSPGFWGQTKPFVLGEVAQKISAYVSIGEMVERGEEKIVARDHEGRYWGFRMDAFKLFQALIQIGATCDGVENGWLKLEGIEWGLMDRVVARLVAGEGPGVARAPKNEGPATAGLLHLTDVGNPPFLKTVRRYLWEFWFWQSSWRDDPGVWMTVAEGDAGGQRVDY